MAFKKVEIKGLDKVQKDFQDFLNQAKKSPTILNDVGEQTVRYIRGSVRARREDYKVENLKAKSQALRESLAKYNVTDPTMSPRRSNLTFTGELLDNMKFRTNAKAGTVTIFFNGIHKRLLGKNGKPFGELKTNAQIAAKLNADPKFRFLFLSDKLKTTLKNRIVAGLRRQLSNYRKAKKLLNR
jgi:hypothetical protein